MQFAELGYPVMEMDGGFKAWEENDLEIEPRESDGPESEQDHVQVTSA